MTDQNELIDVIGLHGNQHLGDDVINNDFTATVQTDLRTWFECDIRQFMNYDIHAGFLFNYHTFNILFTSVIFISFIHDKFIYAVNLHIVMQCICIISSLSNAMQGGFGYRKAVSVRLSKA